MRNDSPAMLINGEWVGAESGKTFPVLNPATGEAVAQVPDGTVAEARRAVDAAAAAFPGWAARPAVERGAILAKVRDLMLARRDRLGETITRENGKPLAEAKGEVTYAANFVGFYAEEARRIYGEIIPSSSASKRLFVIRQPVGVVGAITPWNFPATMITRKISPALAAGCAVVLKPPRLTPLTALALGRIFEEAELPPGVLNLVTSSDASGVVGHLLSDPRVRKIGFTGSTEVGKRLMKGAADQLKRVSFELGGHAPLLIFEDADLAKAAEGAVLAKYLRAGGQSCICINRIYVHASVLDGFTRHFVERVEALKVGNGMEEGVQVGPLINRAGFEKVVQHVEDARAKGAKVLCGGRRLTEHGRERGYFYQPTVLGNVNHSMLVTREETFGPVAPIISFGTEEEAVAQANDTEYGLAAYVYTRDLHRALRVAERIEAGMIGLYDPTPQTPEAPFGGFKESGIGREGGRQGLDEYLEDKFISVGGM